MALPLQFILLELCVAVWPHGDGRRPREEVNVVVAAPWRGLAHRRREDVELHEQCLEQVWPSGGVKLAMARSSSAR